MAAWKNDSAPRPALVLDPRNPPWNQRDAADLRALSHEPSSNPSPAGDELILRELNPDLTVRTAPDPRTV